MAWPLLSIFEYPVALIVAAIVVYVLSSKLGDRAAPNYRGIYDPEGNSARAHGRAVRQSVLLATGIAGAVKLPAILNGIAKFKASVTGI